MGVGDEVESDRSDAVGQPDRRRRSGRWCQRRSCSSSRLGSGPSEKKRMLAMPAFSRAMAASRSFSGSSIVSTVRRTRCLSRRGNSRVGLRTPPCKSPRPSGSSPAPQPEYGESDADATAAAPGGHSYASGDGNQRGEMTVPVTEFKRLDAAGACRHGLVELVGSARPAKAASPSCFHTRYSALNRGAEKASRAR